MASDSVSEGQTMASGVCEHRYSTIRNKARRYMDSHPGLDNSAKNLNCHAGFYDLIEGRLLTPERLDSLDNILDYRLDRIERVGSYITFLGLDLPITEQIDLFDESDWLANLTGAERSNNLEQSKMAQRLFGRYSLFGQWVHELCILPGPMAGQGWQYSKPSAYLKAKLAESSLSEPIVRDRLLNLSQSKWFLVHPV
jgi:hypothetical protein